MSDIILKLSPFHYLQTVKIIIHFCRCSWSISTAMLSVSIIKRIQFQNMPSVSCVEKQCQQKIRSIYVICFTYKVLAYVFLVLSTRMLHLASFGIGLDSDLYDKLHRTFFTGILCFNPKYTSQYLESEWQIVIKIEWLYSKRT